MSKLTIFHRNMMQEFKKRGIHGKFTIVKDSQLKNSKLIVSICVFRMPDPYKDESAYINGLNLMLDNFAQVMESTILRVYYDDSVLKKDNRWEFLLEKAKTKSFVQLVHYDFEQFKKPNSFYHEGVFGMIVRYFVLFDFGTDETIMLDDIDHINVQKFKEFYEMVKKGLKILKTTKTTYIFGTYGYRAYISKPRLMISKITTKYDFNIRMLTQPSLCSKKLDKDILLNFMACVLEKCQMYQDWMNENIKNIDCKSIPKHNQKKRQQCNYIEEIKELPTGVFMFGTDEFFLNEPILESFLRDKTPFIVYYEMPSMTHYHYALYLMFKQRRLPINVMFDMYEVLLGRKMRNADDIHKAFGEIDKQIYTLKANSKGVIQDTNSRKIFKLIYDFLYARADMLLSLPSLERFEIQMFQYIKNTKEEDFAIGKHFYKVEYGPNKDYKLVRSD